MKVFLSEFFKAAKEGLSVAGAASLVTFITVLFQYFGLPTPDPDVLPDLPDIVGAGPEAMQAVNAKVAQAVQEADYNATVRTAISFPAILYIAQVAFKLISLFGDKEG